MIIVYCAVYMKTDSYSIRKEVREAPKEEQELLHEEQVAGAAGGASASARPGGSEREDCVEHAHQCVRHPPAALALQHCALLRLLRSRKNYAAFLRVGVRATRIILSCRNQVESCSCAILRAVAYEYLDEHQVELERGGDRRRARDERERRERAVRLQQQRLEELEREARAVVEPSALALGPRIDAHLPVQRALLTPDVPATHAH